MKNTTTQQEILLLTGTSFVNRQYNERDYSDPAQPLPPNETLKDACWNGEIRCMIPEIFQEEDPQEDPMFLWQVREANQFYALEMSEFPIGINKYMSIDPYRFIEVQVFN